MRTNEFYAVFGQVDFGAQGGRLSFLGPPAG